MRIKRIQKSDKKNKRVTWGARDFILNCTKSIPTFFTNFFTFLVSSKWELIAVSNLDWWIYAIQLQATSYRWLAGCPAGWMPAYLSIYLIFHLVPIQPKGCAPLDSTPLWSTSTTTSTTTRNNLQNEQEQNNNKIKQGDMQLNLNQSLLSSYIHPIVLPIRQ